MRTKVFLVYGAIDLCEVSLPVKRVVCHRCDGTGTHVNPAIDGNGLSREDFDEDPDFEEAYFSGAYDIRCELCDGEMVIDEIDEDRCKTRLSWWKGMIRYHRRLQLEHEGRMEELAEQRFGA